MFSSQPFKKLDSEEIDEKKMISKIPKSVYQDAIYFGPTIRYIDIDLDNPRHKFYLEKGLEIFVYDSIYRNILSGDHKENIDRLRSEYGDIQARIRNQGAFFGVGGCATLEAAGRYSIGQLRGGIFIGINTLQNDQYRVKIDANTIYQILYGHKNQAAGEEEILHMYLDEDGALLRQPIDGVRRNFLPCVEWVVDGKAFVKGRLHNPMLPNLFKPGETIDLRAWFVREQEKVSEERMLFMSRPIPKLVPSIMLFSLEDVVDDEAIKTKLVGAPVKSGII